MASERVAGEHLLGTSKAPAVFVHLQQQSHTCLVLPVGVDREKQDVRKVS